MAGIRRTRVVAEITPAYIRQLAIKSGCPVSEDHVLTFINQNGHAYEMWMRMMQAGEDFIMSNLPKVLSKGGPTRSNEASLKSETLYFPTYPTNPDARADVKNTLRI